MKFGEKESFIFQDGTKTYRCAAEQEGYQCPMCPKVFSQLGRHINSSECGKNIDTKRFTAELKRYLKIKNKNKQKAENVTEYRQKAAEAVKKVRLKKIEQNQDECRHREAEKEMKSRKKRVEQNQDECRRRETEKKMKSRKRRVEQNQEECRQKEAEKK